jgi:hypothetical protein
MKASGVPIGVRLANTIYQPMMASCGWIGDELEILSLRPYTGFGNCRYLLL